MGPLSNAVEPETLIASISPAIQRSAASPDMALSLPAARNFQPADFASMRDALFAPRPIPQAKRPPGDNFLQRPSRRRAAEGVVEPSRQDNLRARIETGSKLDIFSSERRPAAFGKQATVEKPAAGSEEDRAEKTGNTTWVISTIPLQPPKFSGPPGKLELGQTHPFRLSAVAFLSILSRS